MAWHSLTQLTDWIVQISEPLGAVEPRYGIETVNSYLILGRQQAALIDSGMGIGDLKATVRGVTDLPVLVINSHHHWDHVGGNRFFSWVAVHALEASPLSQDQDVADVRQALARPAAQAVLPAGFRAEDYRVPAGRVSRLLGDGDEIDLGDRRLTVLHTPGHCPGHCGFWDPDAGVLFSADTAYQGPMYTCFPGGDPVAFAESAHRLAGLPGVTLICPGHNRPIRDAAWLGALAHGATAALEGRHPHTARRGFVTGRVFQFPTFSLWLPLHPS